MKRGAKKTRYVNASGESETVRKQARRRVRDTPVLSSSPASRQRDLEGISGALTQQLALMRSDALVFQGDALALLKSVPDQSVSLILTDPPYHATKKQNIYA